MEEFSWASTGRKLKFSEIYTRPLLFRGGGVGGGGKKNSNMFETLFRVQSLARLVNPGTTLTFFL